MTESGVFLDNQKLKDAIYAWTEASKKTIAFAVNKTARDIAYLASSQSYTKQASDVAIEQLGSRQEVDVNKTIKISSGLGGAKRLKFKAGTKWKSSPDVGTFKLANWIMKNQGLPPLGKTKKGIPGRGFGGIQVGGTIGQIAKRLIAARKRSIGFIRLGWTPAVQALGGALTRGDFGPKTIKRLGGAIPAKPISDIAEATIINRAGRYDIRYHPARKRVPSGAIKIATDGLRKAVAAKTKDLIDYVKSKMTSDWNK